MERAHCVGVRPRSFVRGLFQTNLLQATFKSVSVTSGFCPYIYIFFFALNDTYWCNIFSFDVSFSTLMSPYCIFYLAFSILKFIFDFDVTFSTLMSQCCVFYLHAAFAHLMTFSSSMLHFRPWCHNFAFFTLIRRRSPFDDIFYCEFKLHDPFKM